MLKKLVVGVIVVVFASICVLAIYISSRPNSFIVQRSIIINAGPESIYPVIADFHRWTSWSPYERLDAKMEKSYSGSQSGLGAKYLWDGNEKAGAGTMEIIEATRPSKVVIKLDFSKPFEGHNVAQFSLEPKDKTTSVSWSMSGESSVMMKFAGLFMNMDELIGKDFEIGLRTLKEEVEGAESTGAQQSNKGSESNTRD